MLHNKSSKRSEAATLTKRDPIRSSFVAGAARYVIVGTFGAFAQSSAFAADAVVSTNSLTEPKREWAA